MLQKGKRQKIEHEVEFWSRFDRFFYVLQNVIGLLHDALYFYMITHEGVLRV